MDSRTDPGQVNRKPVILAVDDDPDVIALIGAELTDRYGRAYRVVTARATSTALERLSEMAESGERITEPMVPFSMASRSGLPRASRCSCPTNSSSVVGRMRDASG